MNANFIACCSRFFHLDISFSGKTILFYRQCMHIHKMEKYGRNQMLYFIMIWLVFFVDFWRKIALTSLFTTKVSEKYWNLRQQRKVFEDIKNCPFTESNVIWYGILQLMIPNYCFFIWIRQEKQVACRTYPTTTKSLERCLKTNLTANYCLKQLKTVHWKQTRQSFNNNQNMCTNAAPPFVLKVSNQTNSVLSPKC